MKSPISLSILLVPVIMTSCLNSSPQGMTCAPSPNFSERKLPVSMLVLHYTAEKTDAKALDCLTDGNAEHPVSSHYLVGRRGRIYAIVDEENRAWHAGPGFWHGIRDVNSASVGIEISNRGIDAKGRPVPFTDSEIDAVITLCTNICARYKIAQRDVVGHSDVALRRKIDPGPLFPWAKLAEHGIGFWTDDFAEPKVPTEEMLAAIGYDTGDAQAALRAFQLHFYPEAVTKGATRTLERLAAVYNGLRGQSAPAPADLNEMGSQSPRLLRTGKGDDAVCGHAGASPSAPNPEPET